MAFYFLPDESVEDAVRRIAHEQTDKTLNEIADDDLSDHETVHQVRKRCKKIRGLLRVVRPALGKAYDVENRWYRDSARLLSDARDARTLVSTLDELLDCFDGQVDKDGFKSLRKQLVRQRTQMEKRRLKDEQRLSRFAGRIREAKERIDSWHLDESSFAAIGPGLSKTYGRGRDAMDEAFEAPSVKSFHEWRKRVKYHWYHVRLLKKTWKDPMKGYRHEVHGLSEYLGDDHDLAVLKDVISDLGDEVDKSDAVRALLAFADQRRAEYQRMSRPLGEKIFFEKPKRLKDRFECYWDAWREADAVA